MALQRKPLSALRRFRALSRDILWHNVVLAGGLALPLAIAASSSLMNGAAISAVMLGTVFASVAVCRFYGERMVGWLRPVLLGAVNSLVVGLAAFLLSGAAPSVLGSLGIYLPLTAVNALVMRITPADFAGGRGVWRRAAALWLGFALTVCALSAFREFLGAGTLWGISVPSGLPGLPPLLYPFGGFITVGFFAAGAKGISRLVLRTALKADRMGRGGVSVE